MRRAVPTARIRLVAAGAAVALLATGCGPAEAPYADERSKTILASLPAPYNQASPARGQAVFVLCSACHTTKTGAPHMVGPNLHDMFGSKAASKPDFAYSDALKQTGWTWDPARLDAWLAEPQKVLPGSKMVFVGIPDAQQRADVIAWLAVETSPAPP